MQGYASYCGRCGGEPLPLYLAGNFGSGEARRKLEREIEEGGITGKVKFLGVRADIEDVMRQARAIVIPSRFEAFGRCMPEAMLCGCLAIARNTGGTLEQLENGKRLTGRDIALRFDTAEQLADMLAEAERMPDEEYRSITSVARETVRTLYSSENYASSILSFYRKILSSAACDGK